MPNAIIDTAGYDIVCTYQYLFNLLDFRQQIPCDKRSILCTSEASQRTFGLLQQLISKDK